MVSAYKILYCDTNDKTAIKKNVSEFQKLEDKILKILISDFIEYTQYIKPCNFSNF